MYNPRHNQIADPVTCYALMQRFNFATLITVDDHLPLVTHLPFYIDADAGKLRSHMARANPQWKTFKADREVLVIFQGNHAYVTPSWYEVHPTVPTWNYTVVHAYGLPRLITDPAQSLHLLREIVDHEESRLPQSWSMDGLPAEFIESRLKALVAFEIQITRLDGKFKISQNKTPADQQHVIDGFSASDDPAERELAALMRTTLFGDV